jgi:hypothetical protein
MALSEIYGPDKVARAITFAFDGLLAKKSNACRPRSVCWPMAAS